MFVHSPEDAVVGDNTVKEVAAETVEDDYHKRSSDSPTAKIKPSSEY